MLQPQTTRLLQFLSVTSDLPIPDDDAAQLSGVREEILS